MVEQAYVNIIFVDGSINAKDNPSYNKCSQEGWEGCGGILITKEPETQLSHAYFREKINTNDPQLAKLQGILRALQLAEHTHDTTQKNTF